jgi:branched-chain amino acid transport system permease protein
MNFVNLSHGSLYMMGAYFAAAGYNAFDGSFLAAALVAVPGTMLLGVLVERVALSTLYTRDHLDQVLATFGLILFFNEVVRFIWGPASVYMNVPKALSGTVDLFGLAYPSYRFAIIVVGLLVGLALYAVIHRTRVGMLIRAGASNPEMVSALGVNIKGLNLTVFALGAGLAGLAGLMAGPIVSVQAGMGEPILILTLVVIVTGGIGSIRGAFYGALIVGVVDTMGRALLPTLLREFVERSIAQAVGPAIASMLIYLLMAAVLAWRPQGLFPVKHG